jgi:hypothetical protein
VAGGQQASANSFTIGRHVEQAVSAECVDGICGTARGGVGRVAEQQPDPVAVTDTAGLGMHGEPFCIGRLLPIVGRQRMQPDCVSARFS